jgi:hypothetical protein
LNTRSVALLIGEQPLEGLVAYDMEHDRGGCITQQNVGVMGAELRSATARHSTYGHACRGGPRYNESTFPGNRTRSGSLDARSLQPCSFCCRLE